MSKFKFETGEVIKVLDEHIIKLLKADKRYVEVKNEVEKVVEEKPVEKPIEKKTSKKGGK